MRQSRPTSKTWRLGAAALLASLSAAVSAQDVRTFSSGYRFVEMTGEELFANVCQGCHMSDAAGAIGAGSYPSLADNRNLQSAGYPTSLVVNGRRCLPPLGNMVMDGQIAAGCS